MSCHDVLFPPYPWWAICAWDGTGLLHLECPRGAALLYVYLRNRLLTERRPTTINRFQTAKEVDARCTAHDVIAMDRFCFLFHFLNANTPSQSQRRPHHRHTTRKQAQFPLLARLERHEWAATSAQRPLHAMPRRGQSSCRPRPRMP